MLHAIVFSILAGTCEGVMDWLQFHYSGTAPYWQPSISWRNKWRNGIPEKGERFWQSSRALVFLTDGWHLMKFIRNLFVMIAVGFVLLHFELSIYKAILIVLGLRLFYGIGFYIGYR